MDKYALFTLLWTNIAVPVDAGGATISVALQGLVGTWFKLCVGAFLVCMMLIWAWSSDPGALQRLFRYTFLASIVYTIAITAPGYNYYVVGLSHGIVAKVTAAVASGVGNGAKTDADAYDIIGTRSYAIGLAVYNKLPSNPLKSVPLFLCIVIYWFLSYGGVVVMFSVKLVSYVLEDIILDFGPLFVPLYFFPFTRKFFDGWLAVLLSTVVVQILVAGTAALFVFTLGAILNLVATGLGDNAALAEADGGVVIGEIMMLIGAGLVCCIFALLAGVMVYVGVRITGGAHAQLGSMAPPSWMPGFGGGGGGGGGRGGGGGGAGGGGGGQGGAGGSAPQASGQAGSPPRAYAFQRSVGSAP